MTVTRARLVCPVCEGDFWVETNMDNAECPYCHQRLPLREEEE